jgi:hypothetical protein
MKPRIGREAGLGHVYAAVLALTLIAILGWAGVRGLAAWEFQAAQIITTDMIESGESTQAQIDVANTRVLKALSYSPKHPDYLDLAGRLQELQAEQPGVVGKAQREALEYAAGYFRSALSVRPLWPYSWVNLLSTKDKLGQVDMEFNNALHRAAETGPWEQGVQLQVMRSGLHRWDYLEKAGRERVQKVILSALKVQPREVFSMIRSYGRPDLVCDESDGYKQIMRWCAEVLP